MLKKVLHISNDKLCEFDSKKLLYSIYEMPQTQHQCIKLKVLLPVFPVFIFTDKINIIEGIIEVSENVF
jgi:hypothetical protein